MVQVHVRWHIMYNIMTPLWCSSFLTSGRGDQAWCSWCVWPDFRKLGCSPPKLGISCWHLHPQTPFPGSCTFWEIQSNPTERYWTWCSAQVWSRAAGVADVTMPAGQVRFASFFTFVSFLIFPSHYCRSSSSCLESVLMIFASCHWCAGGCAGRCGLRPARLAWRVQCPNIMAR